jgi:hypothetical protein
MEGQGLVPAFSGGALDRRTFLRTAAAGTAGLV